DLAAPMIGDPDALDADRDRSLRILRMEHPLERQRPLPAVANARDLLPGEGTADFVARESYHLVGAGSFTRIGLQIGKLGMTILGKRSEPTRGEEHVEDHPQIGA